MLKSGNSIRQKASVEKVTNTDVVSNMVSARTPNEINRFNGSFVGSTFQKTMDDEPKTIFQDDRNDTEDLTLKKHNSPEMILRVDNNTILNYDNTIDQDIGVEFL